MADKKKNYLLEKIVSVFSQEEPGKVLDVGCGDGEYSLNFKNLGFDVLALDMDVGRFKHKDKIKFKQCNVTKALPFDRDSFDYVLLAEVIEHLKNPYEVVNELKRVLKPGGKLILSTPNILNLKSRVRYLVEGCWDYFREPLIEHADNPKEVIWNLHVIPWRYHELEYLLSYCGFDVQGIYASKLENRGLSFLVPLIKFQLNSKISRSRKNGGLDYSRIAKVICSKELLFGRHLIIKAVKNRP